MKNETGYKNFLCIIHAYPDGLSKQIGDKGLDPRREGQSSNLAFTTP